jgi:hypothetical protein
VGSTPTPGTIFSILVATVWRASIWHEPLIHGGKARPRFGRLIREIRLVIDLFTAQHVVFAVVPTLIG